MVGDHPVKANEHMATMTIDATGHIEFFYLGELIEVGPADRMFTAPRQKRTQEYITGRFG